MQKRYRLAVSLFALVLPLAACLDFTTLSGSGQQQGGNPSGPSVVPVPAGSVAAVVVSKFGEDCPDGVSPTNNPTTVRVACTARVTCTPKLADGSDAPPAVHGPAPDFFGVVSGAQYFSTVSEENAFNLQMRALGPGVASIGCTVKGTASPSRTLEVVN